ncbi:MAG: hypothetical protein ACSHXY_07605 [Alphaproteobacteria bacterium]
MLRCLFTFAVIAALSGIAVSSTAQTVSPMKKHISSFAENFIVQVTIANPYDKSQVSEIEIFDANWTPVKGAVISQRRALLGSGHTLKVTALVPFNGAKETYVYLCHSITPGLSGRGTSYRGEVCGKYTARRLSA